MEAIILGNLGGNCPTKTGLDFHFHVFKLKLYFSSSLSLPVFTPPN